MKCLVLGGKGFIGSHLCGSLVNMGYEVNLLNRNADSISGSPPIQGIVLYSGDLSDQGNLKQAISGCDYIFHLISNTPPRGLDGGFSQSLLQDQSDTLSLLEQARRSNVKKIIFVSSGGTVYGMPQRLPIAEDHPTYPINPYGVSKVNIENYLHLYWQRYGLDYCIFRVANAYGEGQITKNSQGVVHSFILNALQNGEVNIWGDGTIVRDFIHVQDVVDALILPLMFECRSRIYNIGTGIGHSLYELVDIIREIARISINVKYHSGDREEIPVNILDISLARSQLGWQPKLSLQEGMLRTMKWVKDGLGDLGVSS